MAIIEQNPGDFKPFPTNEQVIRTLERKHEMVKDAWRNLKDVEEGSMQMDWIFEHYCTVLDHTKRLFRDDFDELLQEAVEMERKEYFKGE